jgi:hypothetical protein
MNTLSAQLYQLLALGLGGESWQEFIDHYAEKYDTVQIDGFTFAPTQIGYTFQQLITSTGVTTLPAYVDPESPGYEAALREVTGASGNIPTMKKFYRLNRVTVREKMQLLQKFGEAALTQEMQDVFIGLLDESTDGLIKSFFNALTNQRMQAVSSGKFIIDTTNNPRGLKGVEIGFNIPTKNFDTLTGTSLWWTTSDHTTANEGTTADPIKYIKDRLKYIRRTCHYYGPLHLEMCEDLYEDLVTHSKVLSRIGHALYPNVTDDATVIANAQNYSDDALHAQFARIAGINIVPRDTYAYVDAPGTDEDGQPDLITAKIDNFEPLNISFVPDGDMGSIMGIEPITLGYEPSMVGSFAGGRLKLTQRCNPDTHSLYIESEAGQLCVPTKPNGMFISTVTK